MNNRILGVFIGNNSGGLNGSENDALLLGQLKTINMNNNILIGEKASTQELEKCLINNKNKFDKLLIYFSGHGFSGGLLNFRDKIVRPTELYEIINRSINYEIDLLFILDCCYSGGFPAINNFQNIKRTFIFTACQSQEKSSETVADYNPHDFPLIKPKNIHNKNIIVGVFTYNLYKLIKVGNILNANDWFNLEKEDIWLVIENIINQRICIKK